MKTRAFSLLETVVSVQILFIVALFCMTMFGQGQRHDLRAREFSLCTMLVNQKAQELSTLPPVELRQRLASPLVGNFSGSFAEYRFQASLSDYETGLSLLEVESRSPLGCRSRCTLLVPSETSGRGIALDPGTSRIYFVGGPAGGPSNNFLSSFWDVGGPLTTTDTPAEPGGNALSGVAGTPGYGFLWGLTPEGGPVVLEETTPLTWQAPEATPTSAPLPPRWHSVACDASCARAMFSDLNNRCIWLFDCDSNAAPFWIDSPCRPVSHPLGSPGALTTDPFGTLVWVADREHNCLRKFLFGPTIPPGYPNPGLNLEAWPASGPVRGYWDRRSFRPPNDFLGTPEGIAVTAGGSHVLVVDRGTLWAFEETSSASTWVRLVDVGSAGRPAGLAIDPSGTCAYINCYDQRVLKATGLQPSNAGSWSVTQIVGP